MALLVQVVFRYCEPSRSAVNDDFVASSLAAVFKEADDKVVLVMSLNDYAPAVKFIILVELPNKPSATFALLSPVEIVIRLHREPVVLISASIREVTIG